MTVNTCIGCGCDDNHACQPDGCYWLCVDHQAHVGVCSECEEYMDAWDAGVRVRKFKPSNGTVGMAFLADWCGSCARVNETSCIIAARTMIYRAHEPAYPIEWRFDSQDVPICTAHIQTGHRVTPSRCEHTANLLNENTSRQ